MIVAGPFQEVVREQLNNSTCVNGCSPEGEVRSSQPHQLSEYDAAHGKPKLPRSK
ncbi:hypothetical protein K435DRAFT_786319 [Dendrothele bispora CBS 962.96]|uniref:Uncharacterized protein n=1 Tax=Dendrothele bispora (strain CBS 962.96) TaxID=1314807 RepID=A0A4V4HB42_DENBC|nr:hypothetical protein K435DRAFT_786459 [Dendrothele bispora CBS 962.96]THU78295.1 hypothetical protein K435DRAFT_786319 [Dendrothele bispora CBS 962.96]